MKKQDREYWDNMILDEDVRKFAKDNPSLVLPAIENLQSLLTTGAMGFIPWMAGLFSQVHNPVANNEDNKKRYQLAIDILKSVK
jgi:hypothetical protein